MKRLLVLLGIAASLAGLMILAYTIGESAGCGGARILSETEDTMVCYIRGPQRLGAALFFITLSVIYTFVLWMIFRKLSKRA